MKTESEQKTQQEKRRRVQRCEALSFIMLPVFSFLLFIVCLAGCSVRIPKETNAADRAPVIRPDYSNLVVPPNIAPLNFEITEKGDAYRTLIRSASDTSGQSGLVVEGKTVKIPLAFWKSLLKANQGKNICFDLFVKTGQQWTRYKSVVNTVSTDPIDPYVAYRLIPPGQFFGELTLNQRHLESFVERPFFDNNATFNNQPTQNGTCANCHCFRNGKADQFFFHVRYVHGGTILYRNGKLDKIDTMFGDSGNSATYPAWHPTLPIIVFSANETLQLIHSRSIKKNETFDARSDLLLYDIEKNAFSHIFRTPDIFETFPCWVPEGDCLYFCSCGPLAPEKLKMFNKLKNLSPFSPKDFESFKYNLLKMSFDPKSQKFGKPEVVIDAVKEGKSVAFPRISPQGRFLIYTLADFGTFPIMHRESDLWLYDIQTKENRPMTEINSDLPETYHSWDSSGRWLVFSSRRDDGSYTRLYFSHIDENGRGSKPFMLPQYDPADNLRRMKSYNIPEMVSEPIPVSTGKTMRLIESPKITPAHYD
ncbi:MAG: hypothetical protein PHQ75_08945 [Thermoguttaceae bacterium]|nr:hypothetical protein [Thermoguttaceae bacterium]